MAGIHISIPWIIAIPLAVLGAVWTSQGSNSETSATLSTWEGPDA